MDESKKIKELSQQEVDFCQLLVFGCDPYAGNATLCYQDIFKDKSKTTRLKAKLLTEQEHVKKYLEELRAEAAYDTADIKSRLTEKLLKILDETSKAEYTDRRGTKLSPAPLRSVAVQASKALMEMYPVKVAQKSELEVSGGDNAGIVFNVIVPEKNEQQDKEILDQG